MHHIYSCPKCLSMSCVRPSVVKPIPDLPRTASPPPSLFSLNHCNVWRGQSIFISGSWFCPWPSHKVIKNGDCLCLLVISYICVLPTFKIFNQLIWQSQGKNITAFFCKSTSLKQQGIFCLFFNNRFETTSKVALHARGVFRTPSDKDTLHRMSFISKIHIYQRILKKK